MPGRRLSLDAPLIMGVVNITPDSFSDGGHFLAPAAAIEHAHRLVEEGADLVDLGAESSRPGAAPLPLADELARLLPVLEGCAGLRVPISVDTSKPEVMRAAVAAGAAMFNDIRAFRLPGALEAAVEAAGRGVALVIMHMRRDPQTMQDQPEYVDVVAEVKMFLLERAAALRAAGVAPGQLVIDPGFGFGKSVAHNLALLRDLRVYADTGYAVMAGLSRKATIGAITGHAQPDQRLHGSVAAALIAAQNGATILRVHDVAATRDALKVWQAVGKAWQESKIQDPRRSP